MILPERKTRLAKRSDADAPAQTHRSRGCVRAGFTIIELLVVIGIISVLAAIVLVAGGKVLEGGKQTSTRDVIRILDTSLEAYIAGSGGLPAPLVKVRLTRDENEAPKILPVADARVGDNLPPPASPTPSLAMINSAGLYFLQAASVPSAKSHLDAIPPKFLQRRSVTGSLNAATNLISTPIDAWGEPIRFVMPGFDGVIGGPPMLALGAAVPLDDPGFPVINANEVWGIASIRRNSYVTGASPPYADGDGGKCVGKRPYFYSAGEDRNPGTTTDNVYSIQPTYMVN